VDHPYSGSSELLAWSTIFLMAFFLCHATVAQKVIFLLAMVNLLLHSQLAWILPFGCHVSW
jgi:hypothetical protein